jgi:uncharacterized protein YndB with AHSA1/START domain
MPIDFSFDVTIDRSPQEVFDAVTDLDRLPAWQPAVVEVELLGDGSLRSGSRLKEVRQVRGKRLEQIVEVAAHEPGRRFGLRIVEGPLPVHGDLTFSPAGNGGTRLHMHAYGRANGALRLFQPLLAVGLKREFRSQYLRLKAILEAEPAAPTPVSP